MLGSYMRVFTVCHVAIEAKFLDDNKLKIHLKSKFELFKLHRSYSISFNFSYFGQIFWVESETTVSELRKRKTFCVAFTFSVKRRLKLGNFMSQLCNNS